MPDEAKRQEVARLANFLRRRGFNVETYHEPAKLARQLRYASKKGIRYVWFPPFDDQGVHEVKDMLSGEQTPVDPEAWHPADGI